MESIDVSSSSASDHPPHVCLEVPSIAKTHKDGCPLRPIISNVGTATRALAGWLASILSPYLGTFSSAHLKNSLDFKNRLNSFAASNNLDNTRLLSFDVVALFTSVPPNVVTNFISQKIQSGHISTPIPKNEFISLIELCVNNNVFQFGDNFYRQKFGVAMGSPLSPVLAGLLMEYFESELLPALPGGVKLWLRYVDDVFVIWDSSANFDRYFQALNNLLSSIKFTVEWDVDKSIPFLDTRVYQLCNKFSFSVYRKKTHANSYIHFFSCNPLNVKRSVVFSLLLRAYRICS